MARNKLLLAIAWPCSCSLRERQVHAEHRPPAFFRVYIYGATVIADDAVDHGQSHPGPFAATLGREERIAQVWPVLSRNSTSRVVDINLQVPSFVNFRMEPAERGVQMHVPRSEGQRTPVGHRISRVDGEVQQDLLQLSGIAHDR